MALAGEAGERASGSRRFFARGRTSGAPLCAPRSGSTAPEASHQTWLLPSEGRALCPADLWDQPLIISHQRSDDRRLAQWMQRDLSQLHIVATYNLVFNASLLVDEGLGYALCFDRLINTRGSSLCFRLCPQAGIPRLHHLEKVPGLFQGGVRLPHLLKTADRTIKTLSLKTGLRLQALQQNFPFKNLNFVL